VVVPITPFLAGRTFEPEQITVMSAAFADTCKALGLSEADHRLMAVVAQHVMGLGQRGVKSRTVLYLLTLEEFRSLGKQLSPARSDPTANRNTTGSLLGRLRQYMGPPC
jgi:hypothetical protein